MEATTGEKKQKIDADMITDSSALLIPEWPAQMKSSPLFDEEDLKSLCDEMTKSKEQ